MTSDTVEDVVAVVRVTDLGDQGDEDVGKGHASDCIGERVPAGRKSLKVSSHSKVRVHPNATRVNRAMTADSEEECRSK